MKVVHVGEYVSGGVATYLRTLVNEQIKNPDITGIVIYASAWNSEQLYFDSKKVKVIYYEYKRDLPGLLRLIGMWNKIIKEKPDVIHLHSSFAGLLRVHSLIFRNKSKPVIIYCAHGWSFTRDSGNFKNNIYGLVERILAHGCDAIVNISNSEEFAAEKMKLPKAKLHTILNGISIRDRTPEKPHNSGPLIILFVGRHDRQKGIDLLMEAARRVPKILFRVAGSPVVSNGQLSHQEPSRNVVALGWLDQSQVREEILKADAVIVPSRWEGFGLIALEAMRERTPVLASDVGGLAEIVIPGENGFLFEPNNVNAIVDLLTKLKRSDLSAMGRTAREYVSEKYSSEKMEDKLYRLYAKIL